jgi:chloramphenicol O-acetyltransferase type B
MESKIPPLLSNDARVSVGRFTYGSPRLLLWGELERISIGSFCSIAEDVTIFGGGEHRADWISTYPLRIAFGDDLANQDGHPSSKGPTAIGHDVWLGFRSIIMSGVTVGNGAIVGAGAVVTKDVPPYAIVAGNPATLARFRFSDDQIRILEEKKWWDWDIAKIHARAGELSSPDFIQFLKIADIT